MAKRPSYSALAGRRSGIRSRARSVFSSASVKSSLNQPVRAAPSIVFVVRRRANSGRAATSVVPEISLSWRDEHAVLGAHEVGLDVVRAHLRGEPVGRERVLGAVARRAAVADDEHGAGRWQFAAWGPEL
jgi:hypothetical protein